MSPGMGSDWSEFYDAAGGAPHDALVLALDRFEAEGRTSEDALFGVDLGCGTGRDTAEMLRRGWRVLAIDAEREAIERLERRPDLGPEERTRLQTQVARFEEASWPRVDLINAGFSLPFTPPEYFETVWSRIVDSLRPSGRFSGHLFGDRDGWAAERDMSFHTREDAERLVRGFELERFDEVENDGELVTGKPKHWHVFHLVARKP